MSKLVSLPASYAAEMVADGRAATGVTAALASRTEAKKWLTQLCQAGINLFDQAKRPLV